MNYILKIGGIILFLFSLKAYIEQWYWISLILYILSIIVFFWGTDEKREDKVGLALAYMGVPAGLYTLFVMPQWLYALCIGCGLGSVGIGTCLLVFNYMGWLE
jgi:hypothetical protein